MIEEKLDQLHEYKEMLERVQAEMQAAINTVLTPEIQAQIDAIKTEFAPTIEQVEEQINFLEAEIKDDVKVFGVTVKGQYLMAVYNKPRVSWDTKALEGYAAAHPEITAFRKEGEPSVTIRAR